MEYLDLQEFDFLFVVDFNLNELFENFNKYQLNYP